MMIYCQSIFVTKCQNTVLSAAVSMNVIFKKRNNIANPAALDATERYAVIVTGAPSKNGMELPRFCMQIPIESSNLIIS